MIVRELIQQLLQHPMESPVYVGKGMGPLTELMITDAGLVILCPEGPHTIEAQ